MWSYYHYLQHCLRAHRFQKMQQTASKSSSSGDVDAGVSVLLASCSQQTGIMDAYLLTTVVLVALHCFCKCKYDLKLYNRDFKVTFLYIAQWKSHNARLNMKSGLFGSFPSTVPVLTGEDPLRCPESCVCVKNLTPCVNTEIAMVKG